MESSLWMNTLQLTLRGFIPDGGAVVGVIVTDGVIVRFDPVLGRILLLRSDDDPPGVRVAPPGKDERGGGRPLDDDEFDLLNDVWFLLLLLLEDQNY